MGAEAQQALNRTTRPGSATNRNVTGTRKAQALARRRSGNPRSRRISSHEPAKSEWASGQPMGTTNVDSVANYGGYGPTAGGSKALKKTGERADPQRLVREAVNAMSSPQTVRATGSIWDDPNYSAMANEHGAEFAMRARNLDQKVNAAKAYQQGRMESMQRQFDMERMKRDNARDQMAYKSEAAAMGSQDDISQAYGAGAYKDDQGNIIQPGAQSVDQETGLAVDQEGAFTGRDPGGAKKVGQAPVTERESMAAEREKESEQRTHELDVERLKGMSESLSAAIENRDKEAINTLLRQLNDIGGSQKNVGPSSAEEMIKKFREANPDASDEAIRSSEAYQNALKKYGLSE